LESGNIELNKEATHVRLIDPVYMPVNESERTTIEAGSLSISLLGKSIVHNSKRHALNLTPWLQQDRWSYRIPCDRVAILRDDLRALMKRHVQEIESHLEREERETDKGADCSVGIGWYYWEEATKQPN
ncbi:MAG: hypothetical protein V2J42_03610, partial [Wenzhouxiangella sp.]|nr:hypothetical protein [Wenzhouxiangella sp.]